MFKDIIKIVGTFGAFAALIISLLMAVWWLLWQLWTYVLPAIYPTGPENFISPSYWLFAGMWTLIALVANIFRSKGA